MDDKKMEGDLNNAVEGLIGDEGLVADVELKESSGVGPVEDSLVGARPKTEG